MAEQINDGHYYLKELNATIAHFEELSLKVAKGLAHCDNEELLGNLRVATGQAKLLTTKKGEQFRQLCLKNINREENEKHPTTNDDLAGFWDLIMIQVSQIEDQFSCLCQHIKNNPNRSELSENPKQRANPQTEFTDSPQAPCTSGQQTKNISRFGQEGVFYRRIRQPEQYKSCKLLVNNGPKGRKRCTSPEMDPRDSSQTPCTSGLQSKITSQIGQQGFLYQAISQLEKHESYKVLISNGSEERKRCTSPEKKLQDSIQTPYASEHQSKNASRFGHEGVFYRRTNQPEMHKSSKLIDTPPEDCMRSVSPQIKAYRESLQTPSTSGQQTKTTSRFEQKGVFFRQLNQADPVDYEKHKSCKLIERAPPEHRRRSGSPPSDLRGSPQTPSTSRQQTKTTCIKEGGFYRRIVQVDPLDKKENQKRCKLLKDAPLDDQRRSLSPQYNEDSPHSLSGQLTKNTCRYGQEGVYRITNQPEKHMSKLINTPEDRRRSISPPINAHRESLQTPSTRGQQTKTNCRYRNEGGFFKRITQADPLDKKDQMNCKELNNGSEERKRYTSPEKKLQDSIQTPYASEHPSKNASKFGYEGVFYRRTNQPEIYKSSKLIDTPPEYPRRSISPPINAYRESHQAPCSSGQQTKTTCRYRNEGGFYRRVTQADPFDQKNQKSCKLIDTPPEDHRRSNIPRLDVYRESLQVPSTSGQQSKNTCRFGQEGIFYRAIRQADTLYNRKHTNYESDNTDLDQPMSNEVKMLLTSHIQAHQRSQRRIDLLRVHNDSNETFVVDPNPLEPEKTITTLGLTDSEQTIVVSDKMKKSTKIRPSIKSQSPIKKASPTGLFHDYEYLSMSSGRFMVPPETKTQHANAQQSKQQGVQARKKCLVAVKSCRRFSSAIKNHAYSPELSIKLSRKQKRVYKIYRSKSEPLMKFDGHYINENGNENAKWAEGDFSEEDSD